MDTEITLQHGDWKARVAPHGASLRGAWFRDDEVLTAYSGKDNKQGGQGDVLIPFPGRIGGAKYTWDGVEYTLEANDKDGPNAIHGFVRTVDWETIEQTATSATFSLDFTGALGYPFRFTARITYSVDDSGLSCYFEVQNGDTVDIPMAAGFHPYFTTGSESIETEDLELPFESVLEMERFIPTGKILDSARAGFDYYSPRPIGSTVFNSCFLKPEPDCDGLTSVKMLGNGKVVTVWMDKSFPYVVIYSGENLPTELRRRSLAIEPMACGSDAFNHPEWGLARLAPGETLSGAWGVRASLVQ
ncbi:MAG: hypothetical protein QM758_02265 [Armatimonas sp.]